MRWSAVTTTPSYRGGHGSPLVLLHGASMSWRVWRPVLSALEEQHEVFAPTMSGHRGGPPWSPDVPVRVPTLVDTVVRQLDEAGIGIAHLVGNSLGGWVALELARRGRARTCVALSPAGAWRRPIDLTRLRWTFRLGLALSRPAWTGRLAGAPRARRWMVRTVMEHGDRLPAPEVPGLFEDLAGCVVIDELLATARPTDGMPVVRPLPCPVRVAWAERDRTIPWARYGAPMRDVLPEAEFVRLPGCGHVPMWDDPALVARTVLEVTAAGTTS